jgi:hypothetical protein
MPEETETTELPSLFAIPQEFRNSLPTQVQIWLGSAEGRIDGLHLEDIEEEAQQIASETGNAGKLFRIARRLFFRRVEQIIRIMDPDTELELAIDLPFGEVYGETPGHAADRILGEYEESERMEEAGKENNERQTRRAVEKIVRQRVPDFKLPEDFQFPKRWMTYPEIAEDILAEMARSRAQKVVAGNCLRMMKTSGLRV